MAQLQFHHGHEPFSSETSLEHFRDTTYTYDTTTSVSARNPVRADQGAVAFYLNPCRTKDEDLQNLFAENITAKIWRVAERDLKNNNPPTAYPEIVPQGGPHQNRYELREASFWTCGFFPGSLYTLLERVALYPTPHGPLLSEKQLLDLCRAWSEPLHAMATRTDTHDLGFIIEPALRLDWELTRNQRSLQSLITAAQSLATRYVSSAGAIRSWDLIRKKDLSIISMEENLIVIIDSLCNLELLFYASTHTEDKTLASIATSHAHTLLRTHLRSELKPSVSRTGYSGAIFSTYHVANIDPQTGTIKQQMTAQGYAANSTWARGQAWAILGYAQTYLWTKERVFLDAACGLAEYFLQRLGPKYTVPAWDFDAPVEDPDNPILDSSASAIAANGMLILSEALVEDGQLVIADGFRVAAIDVMKALLQGALATEEAKFIVGGPVCGFESNASTQSVADVISGRTFDAILKNGTANNNAGANRRYSNHGLVYADYYLLQFGNRLLRMGLV